MYNTEHRKREREQRKRSENFAKSVYAQSAALPKVKHKTSSSSHRRRRREGNEEEAKKNGCLILLSSQSHKSTTRKINTFNSYQHGERCDRFIDGFLFHSIRRRALVRRHLSSKLSLSKSSRLFFAFVFFFFNDEFFLREKCKKRRICVSG